MKNNALSIAIVASIGLFLASISLGIAFYKTKKPTKTVSVVGLAEKDFTSDLIVWELNLNAQDMDMKQAYTTIKEQSAVVREFLKNKNIKDSEVDFSFNPQKAKEKSVTKLDKDGKITEADLEDDYDDDWE